MSSPLIERVCYNTRSEGHYLTLRQGSGALYSLETCAASGRRSPVTYHLSPVTLSKGTLIDADCRDTSATGGSRPGSAPDRAPGLLDRRAGLERAGADNGVL